MENDASNIKVDSKLSSLVFTKEHLVEHNSKDILSHVQPLESASKVNNQLNKGKQHVFHHVQQSDMPLRSNDIQQTEVIKGDLAHVDMDCESKVVSLPLLGLLIGFRQ